MWTQNLSAMVNEIKLRNQNGTGRPYVYATGHSLGGAMSQYFAAAARNAGLPITGVYAFASPNTGGRDAWFSGDGKHSWISRYK